MSLNTNNQYWLDVILALTPFNPITSKNLLLFYLVYFLISYLLMFFKGRIQFGYSIMPLPLVVLWSAVLILRCKLRMIQTEIPLRFLFNFFVFYYYRNQTVGKNMKSTMACYLRTKQKIDMPTLLHVRAVIIRLREVILSCLFKCQLSSPVRCREVTFITFNLS